MNPLRRRLPLILLAIGVLGACLLLTDVLRLPFLGLGEGADSEEGAWYERTLEAEGSSGEDAGLLGSGPGLAGGGRTPRELRAASQSDPAAQPGASADSLPRTGPGVAFEGTVRDADGRIASDVRVLLLDDAGTLEFATDADGRFSERVPPGRYTVWMRGGASGGLWLASFLIDGDAQGEREFQLKAAGELVIVVQRGSERVSGVPVSVRAQALAGVEPLEGVTGGDGEARFPELPQARYDITAQIPDGPRVQHQAYASPNGKPILVRVPDAVLFQGTVRAGVDGPGVGGARLLLQVRPRGSAGSMEAEAITAADGSFEVSVPQGAPSWIAVEAAGYAPWPTAKGSTAALRMVKGLAGKGPVQVTIPLESGNGLSGRVTNESSGRGVSGLTLRFRPRRGSVLEARTDEGGRYAIDNLNPDRYEISIRDDLWYPAEGQKLQVDVPAGARAGVTMDVRVQPARAISGTVVLADGSGVNGARVWIVGGGRVVRSVRDAGRELETFSNAAGHWQIRDVPPNLAVFVRAALGTAEAAPVFVAAERASAQDVKLRLAPTGVVTGMVVDLITRDPIAGARVEARPMQGDGRTGHSLQTDAQGRYVLEGLLPGEWQLRASRNGYLEVEPESITLRAGADEVRADLRVDPGEIFAGRVIGPDGKPLSGARVMVYGTDEEGKKLKPQSASTRSDGLFRLTGFARRGLYELRVDKGGYQVAFLKAMRGGSAALNISMEPKQR